MQVKKIVIYESAYGNTKQIAEIVASEIGAEAIHVDAAKTLDFSDLKLLIVGSPINGWRPLPKISEFLLLLPQFKDVKASAFDTRVKLFIHGDAKNKIAAALKAKGAEIVGEPQAFYVKGSEGPLFEGEIERAKEWARSIGETSN